MLRSATFSSRLLLALGVGMVGALSDCQTPPRPLPTAVTHTEQFVAMATPGSPPVGTGAPVTAANGRSINTNARVTIVSAATDGSSVTFTGPNGVTHTVDVQDPGMQAFVRRLKAGDQVDVAYGAEIVVRLDPAP